MKILLYIVIIFIIFIAFVICESIREHSYFKIKKYKITNDKIPESFKNKRVIMFSDLHNACYGKDNEKLYSKIKEINPDFIIIGGDMPVANSKNSNLNMKTASFVASLSDIADIYYGVGNHEKRMQESEHLIKDWERYRSIISDYKGKHNIYYLDNKKFSVSKNGDKINIYGLDLEMAYYERFSKHKLSGKTIREMLGDINNDEFNILIAHNPEYFNSYISWGADLVLSGHIHGGMVRLPLFGGVISPKLRFFPYYDYGLYEKDNKIMILSGGLGSHSIKLRLNNVPEVVIIEF